MLLSPLSMIYTTHMLIESINLAIIVYVVSSSIQSMSTGTKSIYTLNLFIEMVWLLVPSCGVVLMMGRVVVMQCSEEELCLHTVELSIIANQWYWVFSTLDASAYVYACREQDVGIGDVRLLTATQYLIMHSGSSILCNILSTDVIHSLALPTIGVKVDAIPGRSNAVAISIVHLGMEWGQCSEVCGTMHSFMPLALVTL
nr:cytochrome c oxidase subunit 2 [Rhynchopus humris]